MFEKQQALEIAIGMRSVYYARKIKNPIHQSYQAWLNHASQERIERAKFALKKKLGDGYYKHHPRDEALEMLKSFVEPVHGLPNTDEFGVWHAIVFDNCMKTLDLIMPMVHIGPEEELDSGQMMLVLESARFFLGMMTKEIHELIRDAQRRLGKIQ
jgi:hypothetical protein